MEYEMLVLIDSLTDSGCILVSPYAAQDNILQ